MGIVSGFKGAGLFAKIALMLLLIATLFTWIAYTCTGWGVTKNANGQFIGLWRICTDKTYNPSCIPTDGWAKEWFAAVQTLVTFGFFGINMSLFLLILYMFVSSCQKNGEVAIATAIVCILTGLMYLVAIIVFGVKFQKEYIDPKDWIPGWGVYRLGYCFGLSIVALAFEIVAGILIFIDSKKSGTAPSS